MVLEYSITDRHGTGKHGLSLDDIWHGRELNIQAELLLGMRCHASSDEAQAFKIAIHRAKERSERPPIARAQLRCNHDPSTRDR